VEFAPATVVAYAAVELATALQRAGAFNDRVIDRALELLSSQISLLPSAISLARKHHQEIRHRDALSALSATVHACETSLFFALLANTLTSIHVEGEIASEHLSTASEIARRLGIDAQDWISEFERVVVNDGDETWWNVLGVPRHASRAEIDLAYRRLATQFHPDRGSQEDPAEVSNRVERMKRVNAAYARACRTRGDSRAPTVPASAHTSATVAPKAAHLRQATSTRSVSKRSKSRIFPWVEAKAIVDDELRFLEGYVNAVRADVQVRLRVRLATFSHDGSD
jgi:DnaJ-domain-containing protein 1